MAMPFTRVLQRRRHYASYILACGLLTLVAWKLQTFRRDPRISQESNQCQGNLDKKFWLTQGKITFLQDIDECGRRCMGRFECASNCMAKVGYSQTCSFCFGELVSCSAKRCWASCIRNGDENPICRACTKEKCEPDFQVCSGIRALPQWSPQAKAAAVKAAAEKASSGRRRDEIR
eukprot:TRINITY_DN94592_c0_g1_i1.p1 TRINITY_DN94592_c0_g1~~TRINITY_DN94592_c0_g1_i1.p1  ORF type:complete len:176 (+),score=24.01 TRINITY_DN94592_c0_g1_i1:13-540(+)